MNIKEEIAKMRDEGATMEEIAKRIAEIGGAAYSDYKDMTKRLLDVMHEYDPSIVPPAVILIYAEVCRALDISFEKSIQFAISAIAGKYGVQVREVESEGEDESDGSITKH